MSLLPTEEDESYMRGFADALLQKTPTMEYPQFQPTGIEKLVCEDIARRQKHGLVKYGKTVDENPLTRLQWLQHLYEELLDGAIYAKKEIKEEEKIKEMVSQLTEEVNMLRGYINKYCAPSTEELLREGKIQNHKNT